MPGEEAIQPPDSTGPRAPPAAPLLPQTSRWSQPRPSTQTTSNPVTDTTCTVAGGQYRIHLGSRVNRVTKFHFLLLLSLLPQVSGRQNKIYTRTVRKAWGFTSVPSFTCSLNWGISTTPLSSLLLCWPSSQDLTGNTWERTNNLLANTGFFLLLPHWFFWKPWPLVRGVGGGSGCRGWAEEETCKGV